MNRVRAIARLFFFFSCLFLAHSVKGQYPYSLERSNVKVSYELDTLRGVNSSFSDFSPVVHDGKLLFTSDRHSDLLNRNMESWSRNSYLSLYWVELGSLFDTVAFREIEALSNKVNVRDHTGPLAFAPGHDKAVFTRVGEKAIESDGEKLRKPALFQAKFDDGKWKEVERLSFSGKERIHAHPTFMGSEDRLIFASDRKGAIGETDLFMSEKRNGEWQEPEPLPEGINSSAREVFPYCLDSAIFFASDRKGGMGGLDLYCAMRQGDGEWGEVHHLKRPMNSSDDDFGLMLKKNREEGYLSSNRKGGKGEDDIYGFEVIEKVIVQKSGLAGRFEYRKLEGDHPEGRTVELVDDEGNVVMRTKTDSNGHFRFKELPGDKDVSVRLKDTDADVELVMTGDQEGVELMKDEEGRFVYRKLEGDKVGTRHLKEVSDVGMDTSGPALSGQFVYEKLPSKKAGERTLQLVDESGAVARTRTTDENGNFTFRELPSDKNYKLRLKKVPSDDMKLLIYDQKGKVVAQLKSGSDGVFEYRKLEGDQADSDLLDTDEPKMAKRSQQAVYGKFEYKKLEGDVPDGMRIKVLNDEGKVQFVSKADSAGYFRFVDMALRDSMIFDVESSEEPKGDMIVKILDRYGNVVAVLHKNEDGFFVYRKLEGDRAEKSFKDQEDDSQLAIREQEGEGSGEKEEEEEPRPEKDPEPKKEKDPEPEKEKDPEPEEEPVSEEEEPGSKEEKAKEVEGGTSIGTLHFEVNSSYLSREAEKKLARFYSSIEGKDARVLIEGHASASGDEDYNDWISKRRARRVRDHLIGKGIPSERIEVEWYGQERLLNDCEKEADCSDEEHAKNRRVELSYR
jgi:outer membrane protein OmpA-like peptidoglycan-associated protein